jgi:hypothetical protein
VFGATHGKEIIMMTNFGHAAVVLALLAGTSSAHAQYYYRDYDARAVVTAPVPLTQAQRTTIYRTIIPQGRNRQPIVRERIVTESMPAAPPAPIVREQVVTGGLDAYAYGDTRAYGDVYAYDPPPRYYDPPRYDRRYVVEPDAYSANASAYVVGGRVPPATSLAPLPPALIADVPAIRSYRYITVGPRVLLVDPNTGVIVAEVTQ